MTEDPTAEVVRMAMAYRVSRVLHVAVELRLADHIAGGATTTALLADATGAHEPSLSRLLRNLSSVGVLVQEAGDRYSLTALGTALRSDVPGSAYTAVRAQSVETTWLAWGLLGGTVLGGGTGFGAATGSTYFDRLAENAADTATFNDYMSATYGPEAQSVAGAYDFTTTNTVVDLGGGTGNLVMAVLEKHAHLTGVLVDLPHVVRASEEAVAARGLADRCRCVAGDLREQVPAGGDVYLLSHVLHALPEEDCRAVLRGFRAIATENTRLLVVERLLTGSGGPDPATTTDISMLVLTGGRERTLDDYAALFAEEGLRLLGVEAIEGTSSVLEVGPA
ncbi:methyltransferase [Lentzea sp. NPDC058436]|uniref:methyltransferase n=1 Tax=Lentzea sp. NPDC058436 TaxID=3346499 RepID=UPI0036535BD6